MNKFLKAFLSFGLAVSIEKLLGFVIVPIYTREFSATEYGVIDLIGTIVSIAIIFGLLQLETSLQRYYYEYRGVGKSVFISTILYSVTGFSLVMSLVVFLFSSNLSVLLFDTVNYTGLIRLASFQIPLQNLSMLGLVLLRYNGENMKFLLAILLKVGLILGSVLWFVVDQGLGLQGVMFAQLAGNLGIVILLLFFVKKQIVFFYSRKYIRKLLKYALPQFPARIGSLSLGELNRFFILHFLSLQAIGIYSISLKIASSIQLLNMAFLMAWSPIMFALFKREDNKRIFSSIFPIICCAAFYCACVLGLFSKELIELIATDAYSDAAKYVGGLALFFALYIVKEVVDIGPKLSQKTVYISYNFFISAAVNAIGLYFFTKYFGLPGVIYAMIITNLVLVALSWITSNRLYYIPFGKGLFFCLLLPSLAVAILMMTTEMNFQLRVLVFVGTGLYYAYFGARHYKRIKKDFQVI